MLQLGALAGDRQSGGCQPNALVCSSTVWPSEPIICRPCLPASSIVL